MLELGEIPFFGVLPAASLTRIRPRVPTHHYAEGEIIARVGEPGRYFQAIAAGAVRVAANTRDGHGFVLGPGQIFGEMSLFTGMPVSATLTAARDTVTYQVTISDFLALLEEEPRLHEGLTRLLMERLRYRTRQARGSPTVALLVTQDPALDLQPLVEIVMDGIRHYAAGSRHHRDTGTGALPLTPEHISEWRAQQTEDQYLLAAIPVERLQALGACLLPEDVVLEVQGAHRPRGAHQDLRLLSGAADFSRVHLGHRPAAEHGRWAFAVGPEELQHAQGAGRDWPREYAPNLDHLVRYITWKEVGIAMSSGAARGFAHVGALEALEQTGIPIDFLCGTSMGGIAALSVARAGNAAEGGRLMVELLGGNRKVRDTSWWPRASIFTGGKVAQAARAAFGEATFADLRLPTAVIASDLLARERAVIDSGLLRPAVLATSAIPGFFPPVFHRTRLMVDGAIVSRVPVDVLGRRRCGLRIAINVVAPPSNPEERDHHRPHHLRTRVGRLFGFRDVLSASWELLGSWGSGQEALQADVVISPETWRHGASFDFDRHARMIECGREAVMARSAAIVEAVRALMRSAYR